MLQLIKKIILSLTCLKEDRFTHLTFFEEPILEVAIYPTHSHFLQLLNLEYY